MRETKNYSTKVRYRAPRALRPENQAYPHPPFMCASSDGKYKKGEQGTSLGHIGEKLLDVIEIQVCPRELGLDEIPD